MRYFIKTLSGAGLLVGVIIGAGMFALPYAVVRAGVLWGAIHLVATFSLLLYVHLLYGTIVLGTPGKHRLPGYARIYVGAWLSKISFTSALFGFYGALLAYGILGGIFLEQLLNNTLSVAVYTALFFVVGGALLATGLRNVGIINFFLMGFLVFVVLTLFLMAFGRIDISNMGRGDPSFWFLPYGIFLFAFAGASVIPDVVEVIGRDRKKTFRRILIGSMLCVLAVYTLFMYTTIGVSGSATTKDAISGLGAFLGGNVVVYGSLIGLLAVFTSYVSLGADLKNIFMYDYGWRKRIAWGMVVLVPPALYVLGASDFVLIVSIVGAVAIGIDGITIFLTVLAYKKKNGGLQKKQRILMWLLLGALLTGVCYEIQSLL